MAWAPRVLPTVLNLFLDIPPPGKESANIPILVLLIRGGVLNFMCHAFDTPEADFLEALFNRFHCFWYCPTFPRFIGCKMSPFPDRYPDDRIPYWRGPWAECTQWSHPAAATIEFRPGESPELDCPDLKPGTRRSRAKHHPGVGQRQVEPQPWIRRNQTKSTYPHNSMPSEVRHCLSSPSRPRKRGPLYGTGRA